MSLSIDEVVRLVLEQAKEKGFGTNLDEINVGEKFALLHSEISEAYEAYRKKNIGGKHGLAEELGDALQRILHLCGIFGIDIEEEILNKLAYNKTREWKKEELNEDLV